MKSDCRTIIGKSSSLLYGLSTDNLSPLDLQVFLPCMAGLLLFVGGIVVGRTFPTTVSVSAHPAETIVSKTHGRYGAPRWIQQVQQGTLVADVNRSL
jgi:hypothetical protein